MLEGESVVQTPINNIRTEPINAPVKSTPLPQEILKKLQSEMIQMRDDKSGGATEKGAKTLSYRELLDRFLGLTGIPAEKLETLPDDIQATIKQFDPKSEKELNDGFTSIVAKLQEIPDLSEPQKEALLQISTSINAGGITPEAIFQHLKTQINTLPEQDRKGVNDEIDQLAKEVNEAPDIHAKKKSLIERMPKLVRWFGLGGLIAIIMSLWKAMKSVAGGSSQGGGMPFGMGG